MQSGAIKSQAYHQSRCHILRNRFGNNKKTKSCARFCQKKEKVKKKKKKKRKRWEYVAKINIFCLKMIVTSGLENIS